MNRATEPPAALISEGSRTAKLELPDAQLLKLDMVLACYIS